MEAKIRAMLQEYGIGFKQNGKSFIMNCPRCSKKDKLYIRRADGRFACWYCRESDGFQGKPEFALHELCNLPVKDIRKELYGDGVQEHSEMFLKLDLIDFEDDEDVIISEDHKKVEPMAWPPSFVELSSPQASKGLTYLTGRGIPLNIALEYGIRYCPEKNSVVFPIMEQGELYGWQERIIDVKTFYNPENKRGIVRGIKSYTSRDLPRDQMVMFLDRMNGKSHCVVTEGPVDAIKAHLCGGNICTLGKAVTDKQLRLIRNLGIDSLYMGLDPDAYLEINRIRKQNTDMKIYDLRPPSPYKDLGEMSFEGVKHLFDNAEELNPAAVVVYLKNHFGAD